MYRPRRSNVCYVLRSCSRTFLAGYRLVDSKNRHYWVGTGWLARWRWEGLGFCTGIRPTAHLQLRGPYCSLKPLGVAALLWHEDVCPGLVTLRLGLFTMSILAWSRCGDGGICAAKILRKHATAWVVIWRLSPRLSPDFSSQTRSITACWRGRFLSLARCVLGSNLVAFVSHRLCDGLKLGCALESGSALAGAHFRLPLPHGGRGLG